MTAPGRGDGVALALTLADQLALGRVLHRMLTESNPYVSLLGDGTTGVPDDLVLDGTVAVLRDDELVAIKRAMS